MCQPDKDNLNPPAVNLGGIRPRQWRIPILHHVQIGPNYYRMGFSSPELGRRARPGQFVMVRVSEKPVPLLRRPFSFHRQIREGDEVIGFEILYKVVGQGTLALSKMRAGDVVDVLGPLGNAFTCPNGVRRAWVIAGGVGVASVYYLVVHLAAQETVESDVFIGGCSATDILCEKEFRAMGAAVHVTTEDCTLGEMGLVTSTMEKRLEAGQKPDLIYACGPQAMMRAVAGIALAHQIACQVSLESAMACGFGVCLGCAVEQAEAPGTYFHVCKDGPVFDARVVKI